MKMGILCAGDQEVAPFIASIEGAVVTEKAMLTLYGGRMEGMEVVTLFSGVGKTNAAIAAQILIDHAGCDAMINAGVGGGMDERVGLFDTVVATESAYWDQDADILTGFHPFMETAFFQADQRLIAAARAAVSQDVHFGRMISGDRFIEDQFRDEINRAFSPLCVDMETAAVAHVCHVNRVPFLAVRTMTDTHDHRGADQFELNCDRASALCCRIVKAILRRLP